MPASDDLLPTTYRPGSASGALAWTYAGTFAKIGAQFFIGLAMARILGPKPYGQMAAALLPISLATLISNGGLAAAILQCRNPNRRVVAGAWWLQVGLATGMAAAVALGAPAIALGLKQPQIVPLIRFMALGLPIGAIGGMSSALLMRDLRSMPIQIASLVSYVLAYGLVGIILAVRGAGVWAVAISTIGQMAIQTAMLAWNAMPDLRRPQWPHAMVGFGTWTLLSYLTSWALGNAHLVLTSRFLGALPLGSYNRLGLVTEVPISTFAGPIQQVLLPAIARTDTADRRKEVFCAASVAVGLLFAPAMGFLALHPGLSVQVAFGSAFSNYASLLVPMALAALFTAMASIAGPALAGFGHPRTDWSIQAITLATSIPFLFLAVQHNIQILCWALVAMAAWRFLLGSAAIHQKGIAPLSAQGLALTKAAIPSAVGLACSLAPQLLCHLGDRPKFAFFAAMVAALAGWAATLILGWHPLAPPPLKRAMDRLRSKVRQRYHPPRPGMD